MTPNIEEISQETQEHVHPEYSFFLITLRNSDTLRI